MTNGYHQTRLSPSTKRDVVWDSLWRFYFRKLIGKDDCVLDLGCGYGNFINSVVAKRRIAVDAWKDFPRHLNENIEHKVSSITNLDFLADGSVDFAFASNVFEHLSLDDIRRTLAALRQKISSGGMLTILQPNYRYAYREYFDDYTHCTIFSHISMADFLEANGFEVFEVIPKFLPLTIKSRLPVWPWLIRAYLASPIKLLGKQMLIHARPLHTPTDTG